MLSWLARWEGRGAGTKWPPPAPVFQKSYVVMGSPSGSLAVNRLDTAKLWLWLADIAALTGATTGPVSRGAVTVKALVQPLHWVPSLTRTHSVSVPAPL